MDLSEQFTKYIQDNNLVTKSDKILVGVSGGADSMVMAQLYLEHKYDIAIAHVNYNLRGKESLEEEKHVQQFATKNNLQLFVNICTKEEFKRNTNESIQMWARDIRFDWFEMIAQKEGFNKISIGTNHSDNIETFFINLLRGSGIKGLKGIPSTRNKLIRPILFANRDEIRDYAKVKSISYINDSSNDSLDYLRNKIRHKILPDILEVKPQFSEVFKRNFKNLSDAFSLLEKTVRKVEEKYLRIDDNGITRIDLTELLKKENVNYILHDILSKYEFSGSDIKDITKSGERSTGKKYYSKKYEALYDRNQLLIRELKLGKQKINTQQIEQNQKELKNQFLNIKIDKSKVIEIIKGNRVAQFDYSRLKFPLTLRSWRHGDQINPLGMKGTKPISDLLIGLKLNSFEKENVFIIESEGEIIWVVGYRMSDKFKITDCTKEVYKLTLK